jgi:hypothetical protein
MKTITLISVATLSLLLPLHAAPQSSPDLTAKGKALLQKLQSDVSTVQTTSLLDLSGFKGSSITGKSLADGLNTYYRHGIVLFPDNQGGGYEITPSIYSVAFLRSDSLFLSLTIASSANGIVSTRSFDLSPYLPGSRLYVYYKENLLNQEYQNELRVTPSEQRVYNRIDKDLFSLGIKHPDH